MSSRRGALLGALGLFGFVVFGSITLLTWASRLDGWPTFLILTLIALMLWTLSIAAQANLPRGLALAWLVLFLSMAVLAMVGAFFLSALSAAMPVGWLLVALVSLLGVRWLQRHPRPASTLRALGRAVVGRATSEDSRLLAAGPMTLLRGAPRSSLP